MTSTAASFLSLLSLAAPAAASNLVPERPKVEYVKAEDKDCLQPVARRTDTTLKDYQDAQLRWLEAAYPGSHVSGGESISTLPAGGTPDPHTMYAVVHATDTLTVLTAAGTTVRVCFDVNLTEYTLGGPEEDREPAPALGI